MVDNAFAVLAIELLAGCQGCDFLDPLRSSAPLEAVRALVRAHVPHLEDDRHFQPDIEQARRLIASGAVIDAAGRGLLPTLQGSLR